MGELGGTLETLVVLSLRNAGRGGVLADSPVPLAVGAQHRILLHCEGIQTPAQVIVRHVRRAPADAGADRFLIGFEFAAQTPALEEVLERWILFHGEATA